MSNFKLQTSKNQREEGFTLIELLVTFSLLAVISIVSIASFSAYNTTQKLTNGILDVKNTLQYAKSQTVSQANTCQSGQHFIGYKVVACCQGGSCPVCLSTNNYEVDLVCSGGASLVSGKNLPQGVTLDTTNSTSFSFLFNSLSGNVTGAGVIILKQGNVSKNITVSSIGVIQ
jgi:Tfp pilus assembly protein FimT